MGCVYRAGLGENPGSDSRIVASAMDRATGRHKGCEKIGLFLPVHLDSMSDVGLACRSPSPDGAKHVWAEG